MTLTIEFPPDVESRLEQAAQARGVDPAGYVRRLVEESLPDPEDAATLALFAAWEADGATDDPMERAARRAEWEELRANLEANPVSLRIPAV